MTEPTPDSPTGPTNPQVPIPESDDRLLDECRVETFRSGGPGGQHQNKTETGVRLIHIPTGIRVTAREERSQHRNRAKALERLRARLVALNEVVEPRKPTRVPKSQKRKRLEGKKRRGQTKRLRQKPDTERE